MVFEADYDKIELQKYSYDVILVTPSPLRHQNNVTKISALGQEIILRSMSTKSTEFEVKNRYKSVKEAKQNIYCSHFVPLLRVIKRI